MHLIDKLKKLDLLSVLIFISLAFSCNFFLLNIGESDRTLPYNAAIISMAMLIIVIALDKVRLSKIIVIPSFLKNMAIILCVMLSPIAFMKSDILAFLPRILMIIGVWLLFLSFFQMNVSKPLQVLWVIAIVGASQAIWGACQFLLDEQARPYGIFQQVNVYGSFLATVFATTGFLATRTSNLYKSIFLSLLSFGCLYLVYLTGSRTAILSTIGVILLLLPILIHSFAKNAVKLWFFFLVIGLGVITYSIFSASVMAESNQTIENTVPQAQEFLAKSGREYIYPQVIKLALDNFWSGIGFENFTSEYLISTAKWYHSKEFYAYGLHNLDYPHSEVLYWFVEGGIVSLFGILGLITLILYQVYRTPKGWRLAFFSLIVPISLHTLLEYPLYHSQIHLFVLVLLIYVINVYSRDRFIRIPFNLSLILSRGIQLLLVSFSVIYLFTVSYANLLMKDFAASQAKNPEQLLFLHDNWLLGPRYERHYQSKYITYAINQRSEKRVKTYIAWAEKSIVKQPFLSEYRFLIFAYNAVGDEKKAEEIQARASYLFPKFEIEKRVFKVPPVVKGT